MCMKWGENHLLDQLYVILCGGVFSGGSRHWADRVTFALDFACQGWRLKVSCYVFARED